MRGLHGGALHDGGRLAVGLLAQVAPVGGSGGADRLAQRLGNEMSVPAFDFDGVRADDFAVDFRLLGARQRAGLGALVREHRSAMEILGPAAVSVLKDDDAIAQAIGRDHHVHELTFVGWRGETYAENPLAATVCGPQMETATPIRKEVDSKIYGRVL